jgi:hypothetical protein
VIGWSSVQGVLPTVYIIHSCILILKWKQFRRGKIIIIINKLINDCHIIQRTLEVKTYYKMETCLLHNVHRTSDPTTAGLCNTVLRRPIQNILISHAPSPLQVTLYFDYTRIHICAHLCTKLALYVMIWTQCYSWITGMHLRYPNDIIKKTIFVGPKASNRKVGSTCFFLLVNKIKSLRIRSVSQEGNWKAGGTGYANE